VLSGYYFLFAGLEPKFLLFAAGVTDYTTKGARYIREVGFEPALCRGTEALKAKYSIAVESSLDV